MTMRAVRFVSGSLLIFALGLAGCSGGAADAPKLVPAGGVVVKGGAPLADVNVVFHPASGPVATGKTDAEGRFTLMTSKPGDGASVGAHKVSLSYAAEAPISNSDEELAKASEQAAASPVPAKFADPNTSGLSAEVKTGETNEFKFDVQP